MLILTGLRNAICTSNVLAIARLIIADLGLKEVGDLGQVANEVNVARDSATRVKLAMHEQIAEQFQVCPRAPQGLNGQLREQFLVVLQPSQRTAAVTAAADIVSMDANGFTVDVTTALGAAIRIGYVALGGAVLSAYVGDFTQKTTTGTKSESGVGFQPTAMIFFGGSLTALNMVTTDNFYEMGFATGAGARAYVTQTSADNAGFSQAAGMVKTDKCFGPQTAGSVLLAEADLSSFDTDGWTLNYSTADASARMFGAVALRIA